MRGRHKRKIKYRISTRILRSPPAAYNTFNTTKRGTSSNFVVASVYKRVYQYHTAGFPFCVQEGLESWKGPGTEPQPIRLTTRRRSAASVRHVKPSTGAWKRNALFDLKSLYGNKYCWKDGYSKNNDPSHSFYFGRHSVKVLQMYAA
jgi:hypothetical protein